MKTIVVVEESIPGVKGGSGGLDRWIDISPMKVMILLAFVPYYLVIKQNSGFQT